MRQSPLPVADALAIAGEIAEALEEAHKRRVMHRDLKPSNVMLTEQGHVKVMDFGLAKAIPAAEGTPEQAETIGPLTDSGIRVGTPGYMSPEQLLGGEADARHVSASYSPHWRVSRRRTRWCGPSSARRRGTRSSSRRSTSTWPRKGSCSMRRGGGAPTSGSRRLDVPEGIRLVIGRRIQRLSQEGRQLLTMAAVVGRSFDLRLLTALGDDDDTVLTALEDAEAAHLIRTVSAGRVVRWEFAHELIRQTLEGALSLPRRQRAHLRVAEAMEQVYGDRVDQQASDLAHHLYQAGAAADPEKTVRFLTLAGDQAAAAGAFDEAVRLFDDALSAEDEGDQRRYAELHARRGRALRSLDRSDETFEAFRALPRRCGALATLLRAHPLQLWQRLRG